MTPAPAPTSLAQALGRIPTGLYIVATRAADGSSIGLVGSLVMQTGFAPPTLCVAIANDRTHLAVIRASGFFALSILDETKRGPLMSPFFKPHASGTSPFDEVASSHSPSGAPILDDALAWLDCRVIGEFATPDHVVLFAEVTAGALNRAGDPAIHLRKNGLQY